MSIEKILNLEKRRIIHNIILNNPGIHLREIVRKSKIPKSTLKYHLNYLEKQNLIVEKEDRGYNRYYVSNSVGNYEKKIIKFLRQPVTRKIMFVMYTYIISSEMDIVREVGKHQTTISYHLKKLKKEGIINIASSENGLIKLPKGYIMDRPSISNETLYQFNNRDDFYNMLIKYQNCFKDDEYQFAKLMIYWTKILKKDVKIPGKIRKYGSNSDSIADLIFEVLPHPYYG